MSEKKNSMDQDILNQLLSDDGNDDEDSLSEDLFVDSSREEKEEEMTTNEESVKNEEEPEKSEDTPKEDDDKKIENMQQTPMESAHLQDAPEVKVQKSASNNKEKSQLTVIGQGTTIKGGISSDGSMEIYGTIKGDVDSLGSLSIFGEVAGNVTGTDILVKTKRLEGNINSDGKVDVIVGTVIVGDVTAKSADVCGAVKGNIDVKGPVTVGPTAIVKGDIKAKSIQVDNGAVVDGYCSLNYAGVNLDEFFEQKQ